MSERLDLTQVAPRGMKAAGDQLSYATGGGRR